MPLNGNGTAGQLTHSGDAFSQLPLAVSVDAGNADYFAGMYGEVKVLKGRDAAVVNRVHILHDQNRLPVCKGGAFLPFDGNWTSNHHLGQCQLRRILCVHGSDVSAIADDCHTVGNLDYLTQLMAYENDRAPLFRDMPDCAAELVAFRGSQDSRGFVQH